MIPVASITSAAAPAKQPLIEPLSKREMEVLRLIAEGCSNKEIASKLFITISTEKCHILTIFLKLDIDNQTHDVDQAQELHLFG
jgi:LuxR family maltose regulon positive regulatory protein